jgi:N-acetylglutamate synthase-like GNAT family acetyltransferase/predicted transcriptional regulator
MSDYRIDRILGEDEIQQLDNLLVPTYSTEYPKFEKWLNDAKKDLEAGKRFAIGIWDSTLIAVAIVKLTASNVAELKSFFVNKHFSMRGCENRLYEETENQCRKSGADRIISFAYCDDTSMIGFLFTHGFSISGKEDLYGNSRNSYILSKKLNPEYIEDPFDWEKMGEWYLRTRLNAINVKDHPLVGTRNFDRHMQIKLNDFSLDALVEIKDQKVDHDPVMVLHKSSSESNFHLPIFIAREFTKRAREYAKNKGVIAFDALDIEKLLQRKPPVFRSGDIRGLVVSIRPAYLERLLKKKNSQYYVKGGPLGKFLQKGHTLVFYSTAPEKCVRAVADVKSIKIDPPIAIWKAIKGGTVFTEKEYYAFVAQKQSILAIEIVNLKEITPINDEVLDRIIPKKDRGGSYFDENILNKILRKKTGPKKKAAVKL